MSEHDDSDHDDSDHGDEGATAPWDTLFAPRFTPRQRALRLAVTIGAPLLALLVILTLASNAKRPAPEPQRTTVVRPSPVNNRLYLDVQIPWARVTLDGHAITPPAIYAQSPISLTPGRHIVGWQAAPFADHTCSLSVPPTAGDTCGQYSIGEFYAQGFESARVLSLSEALSTVQPGPKAQLVDAIQAALSATGGSDIAPAGQLVLDARGPVTTPQPLTATLAARARLNPGGPPNKCLPSDVNPNFPQCAVSTALCVDLCPVPYANRLTLPDLVGKAWLALAPYDPSYTYASASGQVIFAHTPLESGGKGIGPQLAELAITWDGARWRVVEPYGPIHQWTMQIQGQLVGGNPICLAANDLFSGGLDPQTLATFSQIRIVSALTPVQGCVAEGIVGGNGASPSPTAPRALYLERFGVFYAANPLAHADQPFAPVASPADQALAVRIAQTGQALNY